MATASMSKAFSAPQAAPKRYHPALVALHWLTVLLVPITVLFAGEEGEGGFQAASSGFPAIGVHVIIGAVILTVMIVRLIVRLTTKHPEWVSAGGPFLDMVGKLTHWGLYILTFGMLITGAALASSRGIFYRTFGLGSAPQGFSRGGLGMFHGVIWFFLILTLLLHIGAALYHQFIKKDNLMARMWFGK